MNPSPHSQPPVLATVIVLFCSLVPCLLSFLSFSLFPSLSFFSSFYYFKEMCDVLYIFPYMTQKCIVTLFSVPVFYYRYLVNTPNLSPNNGHFHYCYYCSLFLVNITFLTLLRTHGTFSWNGIYQK